MNKKQIAKAEIEFEKREAKLKATHERVRNSMTVEQLSVAQQVDVAFEAEKRDLDSRFDAESNLRQWAKELCGVVLDFSEIEDFRSECKSRKPGLFYYHAKRGRSDALFKTAFGTIDRADRYVATLERTVIDITNNSQFTPLSFSGLIKLAFKRLFKRSK